MVTTIMDANNIDVNPQLTAYRYDQLNRITKMKTIWGDNISDIITNNIWTGSFGDHYAESYHYDANGNIVHLTRNDRNGNGFDNLQYDYNVITTDLNPTLSELKNNRLAGLTQTPGFGGVQSTTYDYDEIGNLISDPSGPGHINNIEWNVYGKIKKIKQGNGDDIEFIYDAMGNRVCKKLTNNNDITYQLYTRDAQGNIMANYTTAGGQTTLTEFDLYGSSRIGIKALKLLMQEPTPSTDPTYSRILGNKRYEISNHLGNVITVFSDRKIAHDDGNHTIDSYKTHLVSSQDYTPFGAIMDGRGFNLDKYRFGFNGKEKDKETYGEGNEYDFGARIYDPRIGRWLALDPLQAKYPSLSPYNFVANNPIIAIDPDGKKIVVYYEGKTYQYTPGVKPAVGSPEILNKVHEAAMYSMQTKTGERIWNTVGNSDKIVNINFKDATIVDMNTDRFRPIVEGQKDGNLNLGNVDWDYNSRVITSGGLFGDEGNCCQSGYLSPSTVLTHELGHVSNMLKALEKGVDSKEWQDYKTNTNENLGQDAQYGTIEERQNTENNETPYINEINNIESNKNGANASYQHPRLNHSGEIDYKNNNADVNKNPSKTEQKKEFNTP